MMTDTGRNRRRRGRRGQRSRPEAPQQNDKAPQEASPAARKDDAPNPPQRQAPVAREGSPEQAERQAGGGRKRGRGKRRPSRRPVITAMPTEVLKEDVRDVQTAGTIILRKVDELETGEGLTFGCPMLTRTRLGMPFANGNRVPRCAMGWALHNEEEALLCMRTPNQRDCWREHPEREAALRGRDEESAAD